MENISLAQYNWVETTVPLYQPPWGPDENREVSFWAVVVDLEEISPSIFFSLPGLEFSSPLSAISRLKRSVDFLVGRHSILSLSIPLSPLWWHYSVETVVPWGARKKNRELWAQNTNRTFSTVFFPALPCHVRKPAISKKTWESTVDTFTFFCAQKASFGVRSFFRFFFHHYCQELLWRKASHFLPRPT